MLHIERYKRTAYNFTVLAVKVSEENAQDVAKWCGGTVARTFVERGPGRLHVALPVNAQSPHSRKVYVGDWVVKRSYGEFKSYNNDGFHKSYDATGEVVKA